MPYSRIIIAAGGHHRDQRHINHGLVLARACQAQVNLVHVSETVLVPTGYATGTFMEAPLEMDNPCNTPGDLVDYISECCEVSLDGLDTSFEVINGNPIDELVRLSQHADLIILGHHHAGMIERLLRSTDEHIINRSNCPVLIVPES